VAPKLEAIDMKPSPLHDIESPWANPLDAILAFGGWSVEEALRDRLVGEQVAFFWRIWNDARRLRARQADRRELNDAVDLDRWWRGQGCPVPCPFCGAENDCSCDG